MVSVNFVFMSPNFPEGYRYFCMRLKENGATVLGVGDCPYDQLHPELQEALTEYYKVDTLEDYDQCLRAVGYFTGKYGKIDWLESNNEYWLEQDAALRTDFNITSGVKSADILPFKSKMTMKRYFAAAGVPAARYIPVTDLAAAEEFIAQVGYPVIVKPDNGVGANATYRLDGREDLEGFFAQLPAVQYVMEEYVAGAVTTYDGVVNSQGEVLYAASHISPDSIMDMANEGTPCSYYVDRDMPPEVEAAGKAVLKAFGVKSRFFHLEFFRLTEDHPGLGKAGDIVALEVNMRPAGGFTPDMLNFAGSVDVYQIWADMVVYDRLVHTYQGERHYCVYTGRRDYVAYDLPQWELERRYASALRLTTRMPDALSCTMGNQVCIACFDTLEEVKGFIDDAFRVQG